MRRYGEEPGGGTKGFGGPEIPLPQKSEFAAAGQGGTRSGTKLSSFSLPRFYCGSS